MRQTNNTAQKKNQYWNLSMPGQHVGATDLLVGRSN